MFTTFEYALIKIQPEQLKSKRQEKRLSVIIDAYPSIDG